MKALEAYNLKKTFRRNKQNVPAVKDVSLTIYPGEILAFLGPNGAGKTTSIKMMAGLIQPDSGSVRIVGKDPHRNASALQNLGAVLEGNRNLYWRLTPEENLEYFGVLKGLNRREARLAGRDLLERFDLLAKRYTPVEQLSRGMQQKLAFAVALVHRPKLLLLDEPTLGLDVEATEDVKILVREIAATGCAILLTTHQLQIAEILSDRIAIIQKGEILAEAPTQKLIQQFSGTAYKIEMETALDETRIIELETIGLEIESRRFIYIDRPELLYKVLAILQPLPIQSVAKEQANLTEIFLQIVKQGNNIND
ncbi:ABC transporter ATP-binding protein [Chroococcidiopsis sp. CCALA 051]|jgi:ABC-2 type transport system ATP-binding protein|uniref:ABC transporter ATP-binding protein n=1 Tax=Chroococcidiopsis sp. CCALA 051 TaxID=869949 RepID=UPI000D0E1A79|nr:ABC transporter ATP-binding protein [Chroococcidiopsis sp. CCALA 051]PSM46704.1 ABC transporter ATP-binding protein [Chroococcidiopsis sp. CCALA 051]